MRPAIVFLCVLILSVNALFFPVVFENDTEDDNNEKRDNYDSEMSGARDGGDGRNESASYFFDFGSGRSPIKNGYTRIVSGDRYDGRTGFGLLTDTEGYHVASRSLPELFNHVITRNWVYEEYASDLTVDGVRSHENVGFRLDLPNGTYRVRVWLGDLEKAVYSMNVSLNDEWMIREAAAFHIAFRRFYIDWDGDYPFDYGSARPFVRDVSVDSGSLFVNVSGNDNAYWQRLAHERNATPPCSYLSLMSQGNPSKCSSGDGPWRYIGGPYTNASLLGLEVYPIPKLPISADPGNLTLGGNTTDPDLRASVDAINSDNWEGGYSSWESSTVKVMKGDNLTARAQLGMILTGSLELDHELELLPAIEGDLLDALRDSREDQGIYDLLELTQRVRKGLEYEFNRTADGTNHFLEADKAAMLLWTVERSDPYWPKMQLWAARTLMNLDPHRWTSASGTALDLMRELLPLHPDNKYLRFYLNTTRRDPPTWNSSTPVISTTGEHDNWTLGDHTTGFEGAPEWALMLREKLSWLYEITDWWVDHRQQPSGAIGGGWTDDVEMIGLFGFDALISEGADNKSLEGARKFVDGMLASGQVNMDKGFSAAFADTEHSAELTGDSLPMMVAVDFGNPYWVEFSMKTAVLMRDLWMGENEKGFLQFKANHLSATKVGTGGQAEDSWINFRAAMPAWWVWWYSRDPKIEDLFIRWARSWVNASMSTEKDKPEGVTPAMIGWPDGEIGGVDAPNWYEGKSDGSVNAKWEKMQYKSYISTLLVSAFEATGNLSFLEPLRLEAELAWDYLENHTGRDPREGSKEWAGKILGQKAIDRYQEILDSYGLPGGAESPELWNPNSVMDSIQDGHDYIRKCLPLMTTEASATDRVAFVGITAPFSVYTGGGSGGALLSPSFTYSGLGRDFAAMVRTSNRTGSTISLYGFFDGQRDAGLVPWALEPCATYKLSGGPDTDGDGVPDAGSVDFTDEFVFSSRGMEVPFKLPGRSEYALEIEKLENGTGWSLLPDPALGNDPVVMDEKNGTVTVTVHNIGAAITGEFNVSFSAVDGNGIRTIVAMGKVTGMASPAYLEPSLLEVDLEISNSTTDAQYYLLLIEGGENMSQITTRNDERRLEPDELSAPGDVTPGNREPVVSITKPGRDGNDTDRSYTIEWIASDPDGDPITISLYYDTDTDPDNRKFLIAEGLENSGSFVWDTRETREGEYFIYAVADDGNGSKEGVYSRGTVTISHRGGGGGENRPPTIAITAPGSGSTGADGSFMIHWSASDPDRDTVTVSLYYDTDTNPYNGKTLIVSDTRNTGGHEWNTSGVEEGEYYVYAVADDGKGYQATDYSNGTITISHEQDGNDTNERNGEEDEDDLIEQIVLVFLVGIVVTLTILMFTIELWFPRKESNR